MTAQDIQPSMIEKIVDAAVNSAYNRLIPSSSLAKFLLTKLSVEYAHPCNKLSNLERGNSYYIQIPPQYRIEKGIIESVTIKYINTAHGLAIVKTSAKDVYNAIYSSLESEEHFIY